MLSIQVGQEYQLDSGIVITACSSQEQGSHHSNFEASASEKDTVGH